MCRPNGRHFYNCSSPLLLFIGISRSWPWPWPWPIDHLTSEAYRWCARLIFSSSLKFLCLSVSYFNYFSAFVGYTLVTLTFTFCSHICFKSYSWDLQVCHQFGIVKLCTRVKRQALVRRTDGRTDGRTTLPWLYLRLHNLLCYRDEGCIRRV